MQALVSQRHGCKLLFTPATLILFFLTIISKSLHYFLSLAYLLSHLACASKYLWVKVRREHGVKMVELRSSSPRERAAAR
jgi:inner membrane protein involved in colicin E2 resistance